MEITAIFNDHRYFSIDNCSAAVNSTIFAHIGTYWYEIWDYKNVCKMRRNVHDFTMLYNIAKYLDTKSIFSLALFF